MHFLKAVQANNGRASVKSQKDSDAAAKNLKEVRLVTAFPWQNISAERDAQVLIGRSEVGHHFAVQDAVSSLRNQIADAPKWSIPCQTNIQAQIDANLALQSLRLLDKDRTTLSEKRASEIDSRELIEISRSLRRMGDGVLTKPQCSVLLPTHEYARVLLNAVYGDPYGSNIFEAKLPALRDQLGIVTSNVAGHFEMEIARARKHGEPVVTIYPSFEQHIATARVFFRASELASDRADALIASRASVRTENGLTKPHPVAAITR